VPLGDLPDRHRTADEGDPPVSPFHEVRRGEPAAEHVVDRHRAAARLAGAAVDQHDRDAALDEAVEPGMGAVGHRGDEQPLYPLLLQHVEVALLAGGVLTAVAHDEHAAGGLDHALGTAHHVGEERVGHVEHHDGDGAAAPGAELAGGVVAYVAEFGDRVEYPAAGRLGHRFGSVEHVAHRAQRHSRAPGNLLDAGRHG
jgi:hypothetical protein